MKLVSHLFGHFHFLIKQWSRNWLVFFWKLPFSNDEKKRLNWFHNFFSHNLLFLGPRGPLVEPSMSTRPVPQQFFLSSYIQAYMPYESPEVSLNHHDGVRKCSVLSWTFLTNAQFVLVLIVRSVCTTFDPLRSLTAMHIRWPYWLRHIHWIWMRKHFKKWKIRNIDFFLWLIF